ncbi:MAG: pyruvate kinase [Gemmatimonadetes bacterium]|nr:pyruvate kinase [Gemmatimonadota bacterium]
MPRSARRAKIICTLGPATGTAERVDALIVAGMDVARLNFSHGTHEEHAARIALVRQAARRRDRVVGILQDLSGPKIRVGDLERGRVRLVPGAQVRLTNQEVLGTAERIGTTYPDLPRVVARGDEILLDDGLLKLAVEEVEDDEVVCRVVEGGLLKPHKGMNLPGAEVSGPSLTPKDEDDVRFGLTQAVDYIAMSFVRRPADVEGLRAVLDAAGSRVPIIAKLETPQAISRLDAILAVSDGVMIARGDLGVEVPPERVPIIQKQVLARAVESRGVAIVATQMLNSMTENPRPTRAETSDVSNAVFDGADAMMLASETASGKHPIEAVRMMDRIIRAAEEHHLQGGGVRQRLQRTDLTFPDAICDAARHVARETNARLIACFTQTGETASLLSKYRPGVPIVAFTPLPDACGRMAILWGVEPRVMKIPDNIDRLIARLERRLLADGLAVSGDTVVVVCGAPLYLAGRTNLLKLHTMGDAEAHLT